MPVFSLLASVAKPGAEGNLRASARTADDALTGIIIKRSTAKNSVSSRHLSGPLEARDARSGCSPGGQLRPAWSQKLGKAEWIMSGRGGAKVSEEEKECREDRWVR